MTYYGYIAPSWAVNAFQPSIYSNEQEGLFFADIEDHKIIQFRPLPPNRKVAALGEDAIQANIGDEAIYTYVNEEGMVFRGRYFEISKSLSQFISNPGKRNIPSRLILSSFLKLHGSTSELADAIPDDSVFYIRKENFLPHQSCKDIHEVKEVFNHAIEHRSQFAAHLETTWKDLIFVDQDYTYILDQKISNDKVAELIDCEAVTSAIRRIVLEVFADYLILEIYANRLSLLKDVDELLSVESIFKKATAWLTRIVLGHLMANFPEHADALSRLGISPAMLGFQTENRMYEMAKEDKVIRDNEEIIDSVHSMAERIKAARQKKAYA